MIVIICALKKEAKAIIDALTDRSASWVEGNYESYIGKLDGRKILVMVSNAGKVNAAAAAVRAYFTVKPSFILNIGVCGGLGEEYEQGDIAVPSAFMQYDIDTTAVGDPAFYMSGVEGSMVYAHYCGQAFANAIMDIDIVPKQPRRCATGDTFIDGDEHRQLLKRKTDADICDMEAGAIAQVCKIYGIPFAAAKIVSDSIGQSEEDYETFVKKVPDTILKIAKAGVAMFTRFEGRR